MCSPSLPKWTIRYTRNNYRSRNQLETKGVYTLTSRRCEANPHFAWKKRPTYYSQNCLARHQIQAIPTCCHWNNFDYTLCWKCIVNLLSQFQHVSWRPKSSIYIKSSDPAPRSRTNSYFKISHSPSLNSVSIIEPCTEMQVTQPKKGVNWVF